MQDDDRCCGSGTCIIDSQGRCWCGQQWDGLQMCHPAHSAPMGAAGERRDAAPPEREEVR